MIGFEEILKANREINKTPIQGKEYAEVNQRIKAFRMVFPTGFITTEMVSNENGVCVFRATAGYREDGKDYVLSTGTAYEKENSTFINKTSFIENCETSAVGRALGLAGFGIDVSVASAEEVQNAILNQEPKKTKATQRQIELLEKFYTGKNLEKLLQTNNIQKIEDLPLEKASELIGKLSKKEDKNGTD